MEVGEGEESEDSAVGLEEERGGLEVQSEREEEGELGEKGKGICGKERKETEVSERGRRVEPTTNEHRNERRSRSHEGLNE